MDISKLYNVPADGIANERATHIIGDIRISVLTPCLIRLEKGGFTDSLTQTVINRRFPVPKHEIRETGENIIVATSQTVLCINIKDAHFVYAKTPDRGKTEKLDGNLKGTYRTLDMASGSVRLGDGVVSLSGVAELRDDSLFLDDRLNPIPTHQRYDVYYFTYGKRFREAVRDFFRLTGFPPMLPRYALGNWWSRYHAYTQDEYLELMDRFKNENVPLSVAIVDMDWHWVDIDKKFGKITDSGKKRLLLGSGWTGYSWNTDLFPDYKEFIKEIHNRKLKTALNLHPADGVRCFETQYVEMAKAMGIDPESKKRIPFDIADTKFTDAYFKYLHHPYERDGIDFWWIDWQQEKTTAIKGLDPLWALNHLHYLDNCRNGDRGLILSRYAGAGSHRYPLGFSGDTIMCWSALDYQPYFTSTASNIGYTWWSHDIGGHQLGSHDDELYIRWLQLGVLSPINRLHSTADVFSGKEPWNYRADTRRIADNWLRFRKKLIPYLYTAAYRTFSEGIALCEPAYYEFPDAPEAYGVKNQYVFGGKLIVSPITEKCSGVTGLASADVYLDGKRYTDIFTGDVYSYKGTHKLYRDTRSVPVLAKEGAIIPLDADEKSNGADNPAKLELLIFSGDGEFTLIEDDCSTIAGDIVKRRFTVSETSSSLIFRINASEGKCLAVPDRRAFRLEFRNVGRFEGIELTGAEYTASTESGYLVIELDDVAADSEITVMIKAPELFINASHDEKLLRFFSRLNMSNISKQAKFGTFIAQKQFKYPQPMFIKGPVDEIILCAE